MLEDFSESSEIKIARPRAPRGPIPVALTTGEITDYGSSRNFSNADLDLQENERYSFSWAGKSNAIRQLDFPSKRVLEFHSEDSINYEKTSNLFVEGDNLEVLKIFQQSLHDKVKMIYIDPPYNARSGQNLYEDDFRQSRRKRSSAAHLQFSEPAGLEDFDRNHSRWLSMMYPRLFLARKLLTPDGVIFVSIDDGEVHNLRMIMNEIFGEENVETMIWRKVDSNEGKLKLVRRFRVEHEYIIVGYKTKGKTRFKKVDEYRRFKNSTSNVDGDPRGDWVSGNMSSTEEISSKGGKNYYHVVSPGGREFQRRWKFPREEFDRLNNDGRIYWGKQGNNVPRLKVFVKETHSVYVSSLIEGKGTAKRASIEIRRLVGADCFPNPKPMKLIQYLIDAVQTQNGIVMDFFAGSGTTAEAVLSQNVADGGNRSFVLVQLPEPVNPGMNAGGKWKFKNSAEITRFRIRAVIENLQQTPKNGSPSRPKLDLGMKVLRLSN